MEINIVSFDIPTPPDYGGVIDVFYKIKALKNNGVEVHLHCFSYGERVLNDELIKLCKSITLYKRKTGWKSQFSYIPYIVKSRRNSSLLDNLLSNPFPILFEGIHTTFVLNHPDLAKRLKIVRMHNVEHIYYKELAKVERNFIRKMYFYLESFKLLKYQKNLKNANIILAITEEDMHYFIKRKLNAKYIPVFHGNSFQTPIEGRGDYFLYHGNLSVKENEKAALYLINEIFSKTEFPLHIAGKNPSTKLINTVKKYKNIHIFPNLTEMEMNMQIANSHVNILVTFQNTGVKLKLLNSLYRGRHCLVNEGIVYGTGLSNFCFVARNSYEFIKILPNLWQAEFTECDFLNRKKYMEEHFNDSENAKKIISLLNSYRSLG